MNIHLLSSSLEYSKIVPFAFQIHYWLQFILTYLKLRIEKEEIKDGTDAKMKEKIVNFFKKAHVSFLFFFSLWYEITDPSQRRYQWRRWRNFASTDRVRSLKWYAPFCWWRVKKCKFYFLLFCNIISILLFLNFEFQITVLTL